MARVTTKAVRKAPRANPRDGALAERVESLRMELAQLRGRVTQLEATVRQNERQQDRMEGELRALSVLASGSPRRSHSMDAARGAFESDDEDPPEGAIPQQEFWDRLNQAQSGGMTPAEILEAEDEYRRKHGGAEEAEPE